MTRSRFKANRSSGVDVKWLVDALEKLGLDRNVINGQFVDELAEANGYFLSLDDYLSFFTWASEKLDEPHLSLIVANFSNTSNMGVFGYLVDNAHSAEDALQLISKYQPISLPGMKFHFQTIGEQLEIYWDVLRAPGPGVRLDVEYSFATFMHILNLLLREQFVPIRIHFKHSVVPPVRVYDEHFKCQCLFDQVENCLVLDRAILHSINTESDPVLLAILRQQADSILEKLGEHYTFTDQVRLHLTSIIEDTDLALLSRRLGVTSRTLARRLDREGTSYKKLREEIIVQIAKRALVESNSSVSEIASKLGYSESSSFIRAFSRLVGVAPTKYRKTNLRSVKSIDTSR